MPIDSFYDRGLLLRGLRSEHEAITLSLMRRSYSGSVVVKKREIAGKEISLVKRALTELIAANILSETIIDEAQPASLSNCNYCVHPDQRKAVVASFVEKSKRLRH